MIRIQILANKSHMENPRFRYTLDFLNSHPLNSNRLNFSVSKSSDPDLVIHYGISAKEDGYYIPAQNVFFSLEKAQSDLPIPNHYQSSKNTLTSVEPKKGSPKILIEGKTFQYDIFETIFFHISRYEEVFARSTDNSEAGWLEEKLHFLIRHQLHHLPVVDQLSASLFAILTGENCNTPTTYSISHDVDILTRFTPFLKFIRSLLASAFYARGIGHLRKSVLHYLGMVKGNLKDPYNSFQFLLRSSTSWERKILYLMAGGTSKYDNKYKLSDLRVNTLINEALQKGYSIGFHPSYNAHIDHEMYQTEKRLIAETIGNDTTFNRQHWLRFDWKITPNILAENGIKTDASMGYNSHVGFRCGTGFPYKMYDFFNEKPYPWIEQPLAFMDSSLIHYCKNTDQSLTEITELFFSRNRENTHVEINFHNSNFDPTTDHGAQLKNIYTKYISAIVEQ